MHKIKAFTVIELLIVLSLAIIASSLIIPKQGFLDRLISKNNLYELYMACIYLQQKSIASNKKHVLYLNRKENTYYYRLGQKIVSRNISAKKITFNKEQILFHPNGRISSGSIYAGNHILTCGVAQISFLRLTSQKNIP